MWHRPGVFADAVYLITVPLAAIRLIPIKPKKRRRLCHTAMAAGPLHRPSAVFLPQNPLAIIAIAIRIDHESVAVALVQHKIA